MLGTGKLEGNPDMEHGNRKKLYLVTLSLSMAMVALGVSSAWSTPVLPKFINNVTNLDFDKSDMYKVTVVKPAGLAVGSLATGYISDRFGRRATILGSSLPIAVGSMVVVFAQNVWMLCITSVTWSCGTSMVITVINYYLSEVADKDVRGTLSIITNLMFQFGGILTMSVGSLISYKTLNFIMLVLPFLIFGTCWWIPETPYYYMKSGNAEAARRSLRMLRGYKNENVLEEELLALKSNVNNEMSHPSSVKELFVGAHYRMPIIIAVGLKVTQMMTAGMVLNMYFLWILWDTNFKNSPLVFIIYSTVSFVAGIICSVLVDRVGRRPLLVYSYIGTGTCFATVGFYFYLREVIKMDQDFTFSFIPLLGIIVANFISTVGFNSLIFIIPAEIFPMNIKAIAMTSLSLFGVVLGFVVVNMYVLVLIYCGFTTLFVIFTGFAFGGGIFSYFLVIETKGKDLRVIQVELQGEEYNAVDLSDKLDEVFTNTENEEGIEIEELTTEDNDQLNDEELYSA